jgi:hypothetical protein
VKKETEDPKDHLDLKDAKEIQYVHDIRYIRTGIRKNCCRDL